MDKDTYETQSDSPLVAPVIRPTEKEEPMVHSQALSSRNDSVLSNTERGGSKLFWALIICMITSQTTYLNVVALLP